MSESPVRPQANSVAAELARRLDARGVDYALGGALALAYWGEPRGTKDVDITLFLPHDRPSVCIQLLQSIGCELNSTESVNLLQDRGYCHCTLRAVRVDVFVPTTAFYDAARPRRTRVPMGADQVIVWNAEPLAVFKMMFFRLKDLADVEQILKVQGVRLDRDWIRGSLVELCGIHDPRVAEWDHLVSMHCPS